MAKTNSKQRLPKTQRMEGRGAVLAWVVLGLGAIVFCRALFGSASPIVTHDMNYEMWLRAFDDLIKAGQLLPAWAKEFTLGLGNPLFTFYPPLFLDVAEIPRLLGFDLVMSIKLAVAIASIAAFSSAYWFGRELWGRWSGVLTALMYGLAPYHLALVYVRGAYAENLAYALYPVMLLFLHRIMKSSQWSWRSVVGLGLAVGLLALTNLPALAIGVVIAGVFTLVLAWYYRRLPWVDLAVGLLVGASFSAFYWVPMLRNLAFLDLGRFFGGAMNFDQYFVKFGWLWRVSDWSAEAYYQLGWMGIIALAAGIFLVIGRWRKSDAAFKAAAWMTVVALALTLSISATAWNTPPIKYVQLPFRFLSGVSLGLALMGGYAASLWKSRWVIAAGILIAIVGGVWLAYPPAGYRSEIYRQDDAFSVYGDLKASLMSAESANPEQIDGHAADLGFAPKNLSRSGVEATVASMIPIKTMTLAQLAKYSLPLSFRVATDDPQAVVTAVSQTARGETVKAVSEKVVKIFYRQIYFSGWRAWVDGKPVAVLDDNYMVATQMPAGEHLVRFEYDKPAGATFGRIWSGLAWLALVLGWVISATSNRRNRFDGVRSVRE